MICFNCFEKITEENICPKCGFNRNGYILQPHYLPLGTVLASGRFTIGCALGAGGFGVTYSAWDNTLNQRVAIKEYLPGEFSTRIYGETKLTIYGGEKEEQFNAGLGKFVEEGKLLAKFREVDGIVHIYDTIEENSTAYIVMEYLDGETLSDKVQREGKIPVNKAIELMIPVLDALQVIHDNNIVHRDIAPNNIIVCSDGRVKLIDFGASRSATGTHSKSLTVLYKQGYTAAEQYQSRGEQGPWTDVYSLAASLYMAITGIIPPDAMERYHKDTIKKISKCGVKINKNSEKAIMNALNVKWENRTKSAEEFKDELLSNEKVQNRYERINEKRIGSIPISFILINITIFVSIATFIGLIASGIITFPTEVFTELFMEDGKSRMISVINMDETSARERLENIGFLMETELEYSNSVVDGVVISQREKKGEILDEGSTIHVVISKSYEEYEMPNVINMTEADAREELKGMNVTYSVEEVTSIMVPGIIVDQYPSEGDVIREFSENIVFKVSKGSAVDSEYIGVMPDLSGMTYAEAMNILLEYNVYVLPPVSDYSNDYDVNVIMGQNIEAGSEIHGGDSVEMVICQGHVPVLMPNLVGINIDEATRKLEDLNLVVESEWIEDKSYENYTVYSQSVDAWDLTEELSTIHIVYINNDPEMPNFIWESENRVKAACEENGWTLKRTSYPGTQTYIAKQYPEPGTKLPAGSEISIEVEVKREDYYRER